MNCSFINKARQQPLPYYIRRRRLCFVNPSLLFIQRKKHLGSPTHRSSSISSLALSAEFGCARRCQEAVRRVLRSVVFSANPGAQLRAFAPQSVPCWCPASSVEGSPSLSAREPAGPLSESRGSPCLLSPLREQCPSSLFGNSPRPD